MITRLAFIVVLLTNATFCEVAARQERAHSHLSSIDRLTKQLNIDLRAIIKAEYTRTSSHTDTIEFLARAIITSQPMQSSVFEDKRNKDYLIQVDDTTNHQILFLGFASSQRGYMLYYCWLAPGTRASIRSLGRVLHIDPEPLLLASYLRASGYRDSTYAREFLHDAVITYQLVNFSGDSLHPSDYLVQFINPTPRASNSFTLAFVKRSNKFHIAYERYGGGKASADPVLIDIDSDGRKEILMLADETGNQSTYDTITIWRYAHNRFSLIFRQGLAESYDFFPTYAYYNRYSFSPNPADPKLQDICFFISTAHGAPPHFMPRLWPVQDSVRFRFNGSKYVPNKKFSDYRRPFRRVLSPHRSSRANGT